MSAGISDYELMNPEVLEGLSVVEIPVVDGHEEDISDFALIVEGDPEKFEVPIVPWPVPEKDPWILKRVSVQALRKVGSHQSGWKEGL